MLQSKKMTKLLAAVNLPQVSGMQVPQSHVLLHSSAVASPHQVGEIKVIEPDPENGEC